MENIMSIIDDVIEYFFAFLATFGWIIILFFVIYFKKVPNNTVLIIDRDSHYHKTKKRGFYHLGSRDKVTSTISTNNVMERYSNIFPTHDSEFYSVDFYVNYTCENINSVVNALQDSRRSIYDIINCAMEITMKSYESKDMNRNYQMISNASKAQIESMLEPFYVDVTSVRVTKIEHVNQEYGRANKFEKHESRGDMPIQ